METRKVNVMGKEMQIPKGMTFGELAKEFEGEVFGKILVAKQGNSLLCVFLFVNSIDNFMISM